jgi:hypothetical protein
MEAREKTSIAMTPKCKLALERLKLRLRTSGVARSVATESAIVEALILHANFEELLAYLSR